MSVPARRTFKPIPTAGGMGIVMGGIVLAFGLLMAWSVTRSGGTFGAMQTSFTVGSTLLGIGIAAVALKQRRIPVTVGPEGLTFGDAATIPWGMVGGVRPERAAGEYYVVDLEGGRLGVIHAGLQDHDALVGMILRNLAERRSLVPGRVELEGRQEKRMLAAFGMALLVGGGVSLRWDDPKVAFFSVVVLLILVWKYALVWKVGGRTTLIIDRDGVAYTSRQATWTIPWREISRISVASCADTIGGELELRVRHGGEKVALIRTAGMELTEVALALRTHGGELWEEMLVAVPKPRDTFLDLFRRPSLPAGGREE